MAKARLSDLQCEVIQKYWDGEFAHCESLREVRAAGDTLFLHVVKEAAEARSRAELLSLLQRSVEDLRGLIDALDVEPGDAAVHKIIPLADRYAHKVMDGKSDVVCVEVGGVRYSASGQSVETCLVNPDFYSVYVRIRDKVTGDALARCIGDFASRAAAREYALHVASWGSPPWEVHEATPAGWIPLPETPKH